MSAQPVLIVTAGHIDHGKSALVKALTGTDPDRLTEEQRRGMTIDLGFAFLTDDIAFVDVPGHERFIKNMVSGIAPVAVAMLVIAADDGVMPQTREHLAILQLLGLKQGLLVINKIDLVDDEWLQLVTNEVQLLVQETFLADAPLFKTSTVTGAGLADLKAYILNLPARTTPPATAIFRLPIDRIFSVKGYGTVVTGSVISGQLKVGEEVEILPAGRRLTVRRLETHNQPCNQIRVGQRAAVNLPGIERQELKRGDFLATPGSFIATKLLTTHLRLLKETAQLEYNDPVHVHLGTGEYLARVRWIGQNTVPGGAAGIAQLLFEEPVAAGFRERFIIRAYSPPRTIGGGIVLDNNPRPLRKKETAYANRLVELLDQPLNQWLVFYLAEHADQLVTETELARQFTCPLDELRAVMQSLLQTQQILASGTGYLLTSSYAHYAELIEQYLARHHRQYPLKPAVEKAPLFTAMGITIPLGNFLMKRLLEQGRIKLVGDGFALPDFEPHPDTDQQRRLQQIATILAESGLNPPSITELAARLQIDVGELLTLLNLLVRQGQIVVAEKNFPFHRLAIEKAREVVTDFLLLRKKATVSELKSALNISRKYALPLFNYFDQTGLTIRDGDLRRLKETQNG